jgi:squalene-hopene/tetraprenyl-beta-curcumene cyclase
MDILSFALGMAALAADPNIAPAGADTASPAQVRAAVERSLPYLGKGGQAWIEKQKCTSCHVVPFLLWSHNEARGAGIRLEQQKLDDWTKWSWDFSVNEKDKNGVPGGGGLDTMAQMILGRDRSAADAKFMEAAATLAELIVKMQQPDGSWKPGGQLPSQRRPAPETVAATTMWTVLALTSLNKPGEAVTRSRDQALAWVKKNAKPGQSNESLLLCYLLERQFGEPARAVELRKELIGKQNADGGWSWLHGEASDAFATGQTLYALSYAGLPAAEPALVRARTFLVSSQRPDGSWYVPTTKKNKQKDNEGLASYWGSAWAVIGLARTLPK